MLHQQMHTPNIAHQ